MTKLKRTQQGNLLNWPINTYFQQPQSNYLTPNCMSESKTERLGFQKYDNDIQVPILFLLPRSKISQQVKPEVSMIHVKNKRSVHQKFYACPQKQILGLLLNIEWLSVKAICWDCMVYFNIFHLQWFHCMTHSQMLGKVEYTLPAKIWRLVGCTEMLSW